MSRKRESVAVVGLGAVTGFGWSCAELARGLSSGETTVAEVQADGPGFSTEGHRTSLASQVPHQPAGDGSAPDGIEHWEQLSRADQFAVMAAREALEHAFGPGLLPRGVGWDQVGVFFGGSTAGMAESEEFLASQLSVRDGRAKLRDLRSQQLNGPGDAVARDLGVYGPVVSFSSACASGALALGAALEALRANEVEVAIAGGSDSLCQMTYAGFNALRAVDPDLSRPFRNSRAGLNLGEGAGVLVLVRSSSLQTGDSKKRPALALLCGAGASCDAHHMTAPHPEGEGASGAMQAALLDAGVRADQVTFVNTHGTGTPHNDSAEAMAINSTLQAVVPITSVKGALGHLLGAAGAVEAVATVLALHDRAVQPTTSANVGEGADPDFSVDLVLGEPRPLPAGRNYALCNSFAFGGANASLVFAGASSAGGD